MFLIKKFILQWLLFQVVLAEFAFTNSELVLFGNDPGSCESRVDILETDFSSAALIVGRTKSKNLQTNTGDNVCHSS